MRDQEDLARGFEEHRDRLRDIAYRMLGSVIEAEDAVQETWLRYASAQPVEIRNPAAWLTTVISRICLDQLRARAARPVPVDWTETPEQPQSTSATDFHEPESEAVLNDLIGRALLVVLRFLSPDERVAFVLHDLFAVPFDEIAPIVGRTPATTKKLASRARLRVRGQSPATTPEFDQHREVVEAFLAASRSGDIQRLLTVLAPDVVRLADPAILPPGVPATRRGATEVAKETILLRERSQTAGLALIDGAPGIVVAPHGRLAAILLVTVHADRVTAYEVIATPACLDAMAIAVLN